MSEPTLRPLTASEAELYEALMNGASRSEFAKQRGVTKGAVTQMTKALELKGYTPPDPAPKESPRYDLARQLFAQGLTNTQVAKEMGVTLSCVCSYRRKSEGRQVVKVPKLKADRTTKPRPRYELAKALLVKGLTDAQIAAEMAVGKARAHQYRQRFLAEVSG